jgi:hypothetical protein
VETGEFLSASGTTLNGGDFWGDSQRHAHSQPVAKKPRKAIHGSPIDGKGFWTEDFLQLYPQEQLTKEEEETRADLGGKLPDKPWPREATKQFDHRYHGDWSFALRCDIHHDGIPTALLIDGSEQYDETFVVTKLLVVKWANGKWHECVRLDTDNGRILNEDKSTNVLAQKKIKGFDVTMIYEKSQDKERGLWIEWVALGHDAPPEDVAYSAKDKKCFVATDEE